MSDIVSQGGDRGPSPWPRWIVAAAVLALVAAGLAEYFTRPGTHPAASHPAAASVGPVSVQARAAGPNGIAGPVSAWPSGLALLSTGTGPAWFWPTAGRFQRIGGLPSWRPGYQFTRTPGGWAIQPAAASPAAADSPSSASAACASCAAPPRPVYYLADGTRTARGIGTAVTVAPGTTPGTLWLTSVPPGAGPAAVADLARQVSVTGTPAGFSVRLPQGFSVAQGTPRGLLLAPAAPQPGEITYLLWTPGAARASRVLTGVLAYSASAIAWSTPCETACHLQVLSLDSGQVTQVALPGGSMAANAAFSPDGRYLALQLSYGNTGDDGALAMRLAVVALPAGHLRIVPQTFASSDALVGFGWPAGGDTLIAELSFSAKVQLAAWHPGAPHLAVATLNPHHAPPALALAPSDP